MNKELDQNPALVNSNAEDKGWIAKLKLKSPLGKHLMDKKQYEEFLKTAAKH